MFASLCLLTTSPLIWGAHCLLLLVVVYTDLTRHRVYLLWTVPALLVALVTALSAPWPPVYLFTGALGFTWGLYGLHKGHWAGGDVWMLLYLGLTFGPGMLPILCLSSLCLLAGLALKRLTWGQTIPLAAAWGGAALLWLWFLGLLPQAQGFYEYLNPTPLPPQEGVRVQMLTSPLPEVSATDVISITPTPDPALVAHVREAADTVALVGLVPAAQRPAQAQHAAQTLRTLAGTTSVPQHAAVLTAWATALDAYAAGQPEALATIQQFSQLNQTYYHYYEGENPDANQ